MELNLVLITFVNLHLETLALLVMNVIIHAMNSMTTAFLQRTQGVLMDHSVKELILAMGLEVVGAIVQQLLLTFM